MGLHRPARGGCAGARACARAQAARDFRRLLARCPCPCLPRTEGGGDSGHPAQRRRDLRPHPRRAACPGQALPATDGCLFGRLRRAEPLARRPCRRSRRGVGELLRRARTRRRAGPACSPGGRGLPVRGPRGGLPGRARARAVRVGPAAAAGLGGPRRPVGPAWPARGGADQPAGRHCPRHPPARRLSGQPGPGAAGTAHQAERFARGAGGCVGAAGRAGGRMPATVARAGRGRGVRRGSRRSRPAGDTLAAGCHRPDGGELPGWRGGRQRDRRPGRC